MRYKINTVIKRFNRERKGLVELTGADPMEFTAEDGFISYISEKQLKELIKTNKIKKYEKV